MAIQEQNIVYLKTQVMDDVPEGGGAATGIAVVDGQMNNVFEDVSDLDRAYGRFNLRKLSLAVRSMTTDLYGGAKTLITGLPTDPALGYTLFTTNNPFDVRAAAAARVAAYLYKGPLWVGVLNENHIVGMSAISVIQRVNTALPVIGQTLCLVQNEGLSNEQEQYVRITQVSAVETTFTDATGDYTRWIVRMDLSAALLYAFAGHTVNRTDSYNYTSKTRIRSTTVADATRYFGSTPVAESASIGDLTIKASSLFAQLVPSAQTETPLVDRVLASGVIPLIASRASPLSYSVAGAVIAPNGRFVLDTGALPGSISVTVGGVTVTDDGNGNALRSGAIVGTWTYSTGECQFNASAPSASGTASVTCTPAAPAPQQAHTLAHPITAENRRLNWIDTLDPLPAPGTVSLSYRAQGNNYTLAGTGAGTVVGSDATYGAGTVSYVTGTLAVTLGALPDVGSQIIITWGSPIHTTQREGLSTIAAPVIQGTLGEACEPGSATFTWLVSGSPHTATAGVNGAIAGVGNSSVGRIDGGTGAFWIRMHSIPDSDTSLTVDCSTAPATTETFTVVADGSGVATLTIAGAPLLPGSVTLKWFVQRGIRRIWTGSAWTPAVIAMTASDDGAGNLQVNGATVGTIHYGTGAVSWTALAVYARYTWVWSAYWGWSAPSVRETVPTEQNTVAVSYLPDSATFGVASLTIDIPELRLDLLPNLTDSIIPGGLRFRFAGSIYVDRAGTLYRDPSPTTGSGMAAGSVDYLTGVATLAHWAGGVGNTVTMDALLTQYGMFSAAEAYFRTALAPIKPEALSISAVTDDGEQITGAADPDGVIVGTWMRGTFDYEFGSAAVEFGQLSGPDWVPRPVIPSTVRYNAVAYSYLPLDASILGIDPVRLPPDGRVPIYRKGDVVQILHGATNAPATPALNGGTGNYELSCGRTRIAWVRITDANGAAVTDGYTLDRASGLLSWATLAGVATPLTVKHTVADLRQITDAQINGTLTLARSLSHDFPADESIVAACLIHGDRRARVSATWDQASWDGIFRDAISGSAATATLNLIDYPITVTNEGADTERWVFRCTSSGSNLWELIGEHRGLVWSGTYPPYVSGTPVDVAPINPRTRDENGQNGTPYLTIPQRANGGGWATGNVILIMTVGAIADFWIARSIQQSDEPAGDGADGCEIYALGNIDRP